jgi:hypothetical protein
LLRAPLAADVDGLLMAGRYSSRTNGFGRRTAREALDAIVADANQYATNGPGVALHGFTYSWIDDDPDTGLSRNTYLYRAAASNVPNPDFVINAVGTGSGASFVPRPALLVQTSGQSCWYNDALLARYNDLQTNQVANRFPAIAVDHYDAPGAGAGPWTFHLHSGPDAGKDLCDMAPPVGADLRLPPAVPGDPSPLVPFSITALDPVARTAQGIPMIVGVATQLAMPEVAGTELIPFVRPIPPNIDTQTWNDAIGRVAEPRGTSYGGWDPRRPYTSNWYDGAERGLLQYAFDPTGGVWRASGFAEHYVMRDLLLATVLPPLSVADNMEMRRSVARWCHRHGLTCAHDIMYYRRRAVADEFHAGEALSFERSPEADPAFDSLPRWLHPPFRAADSISFIISIRPTAGVCRSVPVAGTE